MAQSVINNVPYDFHSGELDCGDLLLSGCRGISFEHGMDGEKVFGSAREAYDETDGAYNVEDGELTLLETTYLALVGHLGNGYMVKRFDGSFTLSHQSSSELVFYELGRMRIKSEAHDYSQGPEGLEVSVTVSIMKVKVNGLDPVKAS